MKKGHGKKLLVGIIVIIISVVVAGSAIRNKINDVKFEKELERYEANRQTGLNQFGILNGMWSLADRGNEGTIIGFMEFNMEDGTCRTSNIVDNGFNIEPHLLSGSYSLSDGVYTINDNSSESYAQLRIALPDECGPNRLDVYLSFKNVGDKEASEQRYTMRPVYVDVESLDSDETYEGRQVDFFLNHQIIDVQSNKNNVYQEFVNHMEYIDGCSMQLLDDNDAWMEIPEDGQIVQIRRYKGNGVYTTDDEKAKYYMIWTTGSMVQCQTVAHSSGGANVVITADGGVTGINRTQRKESIHFNYETPVPKDEIWTSIKQAGYSGSTDDGYFVKVLKLDTISYKDRIDAKTQTIYGLVNKQIVGEYTEDGATLSHETMGTVDDSDATVVKTGKSSTLMYELRSNGVLDVYSLDESDIDDSRDRIRVQLKYNLDDVIAARVHEGVIVLEDSIFMEMEYLNHVELPSTLIRIDRLAFSNCKNLREIVIPDSVTEIGNSAFSWSGLETIIIPDSVTKIGGKTFSACKSLTNVQFPNNLQSIGEEAFANCNALRNVQFPNNLQSIGKRAFANCNALRVVEIPESVAEIGDQAFLVDSEYIREITVHENTMRAILEKIKRENELRSRLGTYNAESILYYDGSDFDELAEKYPSINWTRP